MKNKSFLLWILILFMLVSCASTEKDSNYLGYVEILPKGTYTIYNYGSRHVVKCIREDGKYYTLNDYYFSDNNIPGRDAHEYSQPKNIIIK